MSQPANIFAGGWTPAKAAKLNNIRLPDKSRCKSCHKLKVVGQFSNKQLLDLKQRIAGPQGEKAKSPVAEIITCRTCTSGQVQELTCHICNETKGLEAFGKTQRKTPDTARCILCVHEQGIQKWADREWNEDESEGEASDEDIRSRSMTTNPYDSKSYQYDPALSAVSSALREVNLAAHNNAHGRPPAKTGTTTVSQSDLLGSYSDDEMTGGTSVKGKGKEKEKENAPLNWQNFAGTNRGKEFTGYDPKGVAHRQTRSPSTVATEESLEIVTNAPRGRSNFARAKGNNSNFAKPARGPSPEMRKDSMVAALKSNATGYQVTYSDSDDSDDEWGTVVHKA